MPITAIIQNNTLIIPNVDLSHLAPYADKNGLIELDQSLLETLIISKVAKTPAKKGKSIQELAGSLANKTTVVATIGKMNESIAKAYIQKEL